MYENSFGRTISCSSISFPLLSQCTEVENETERKIQGGACCGAQQRSLAKFDKIYEKFDPIKSSEKVGQLVDYIEKLSEQNKDCKGYTLKSKEFHCGLFVKRLRKGHVICNYKDEPRKTTSIDNNLYYFVDSLAAALEKFIIPKAHAGMWDEFREEWIHGRDQQILA